MNLCVLTGNLGNDPEVRFLPDGTPAINFNLATTKRWKDRNGEKKEQTTWHRCVKIGTGADKLATYLGKGSKILVVGEIANREWADNDGNKKRITEVKIKELEFLSATKKGGNAQEPEPGPDLGPDPYDDVPF